MVSLTALWLPILVAAALVFVVSSIIHMATPWHAPDWRRFADEDGTLEALRRLELAPGDYVAPLPKNMAEMSTPQFQAKLARGPRVQLTVLGLTSSLGRNLALWFGYSLVVSLFAAYVAALTLGAAAPYMTVFRVTSTVAFSGYALALWQNWVWYSRSLGYTVRTTIDGLVYALCTGGAFGWLWP